MTTAVLHAGTTLTRAFHALGNHNFRLFWVGMLIAALGVQLHVLALAWLVLRQTRSPLALGVVAAVEGVPILLFALFGGTLADRVHRRWLITVCRAVMVVEAVLFAVFVSLDAASIWVIYIFVAIGGALNAVDIPAGQSFLEELVGSEQADLANASALLSTLFHVATVAGALAGGVIIAAIGEAPCFYIAAASILGMLVTVLVIDERRLYPASRPPAADMLGTVKEGLSYAVRTPDVATVVLLIAAIGLFGFNVSVLLPLIVRYVLDAGPAGLGLLTAAWGAGSLVASLLVASIGRGRRHTVLAGAVAFTVALALLPLSTHWLLVLPSTAIAGFCSVVCLATANARLHLICPDELRGRVMGIYTVLLFGVGSFGGLLAGALAERLGVRETTVLLAGICAIGVLAAILYIRRRREDLPPEQLDVDLLDATDALRYYLPASWRLLRW